MKKRLFFMTILVFSLLFQGCTQNYETNDSQTKLQTISMKTSHPYDQSISVKAINLIKEVDGIQQAVSVNTDQDLLVAFKVNHFKRFQRQKIEAKTKKILEKHFKDYQVTTSNDLKIFIETEKLAKEQPKHNKKKFKKKVKKIIQLSKEQA